MMPKRTQLQIIAEMLILCKQPQTKTWIMYGTNLSWRMTQKYLAQLRARGLLEIHHSPTKYQTTTKGQAFIEKWRALIKLV